MLVMAQTQDILFTIFYDLTCQDLPPALEDSHSEFFAEPNGWFPRFLQWDPAALKGDVSAAHCVHICQLKRLLHSPMTRVRLSLRKLKRISLRLQRYLTVLPKD